MLKDQIKKKHCKIFCQSKKRSNKKMKVDEIIKKKSILKMISNKINNNKKIGIKFDKLKKFKGKKN
jgi:methylaspartate ammonia-lyase